MGTHEQSVGATDEWYTPSHVFGALGCQFDLDVASPGSSKVPWIPASNYFKDGSLDKEWYGFVWMNPPFGGRNGIVPWIEKFIQHGNGICLVPDRTSAPWWQEWACRMDLILFIAPRLRFIGADGVPGKHPAQGSCLGGLGIAACEALHRASVGGLGILAKPVLGVVDESTLHGDLLELIEKNRKSVKMLMVRNLFAKI